MGGGIERWSYMFEGEQLEFAGKPREEDEEDEAEETEGEREG